MKKLMLLLVLSLFNGYGFAQEMGEFTDSRDGKTYKTVKIGDQYWMAENLNFEKDGSRCYKNKDGNCDKYGRLYTYEAAVTNACPPGWHLPVESEYRELLRSVGEDDGYDAYETLRDGGSSSFSILLGGYSPVWRDDRFLGEETGFWASSQSKTSSWDLYIHNNPGRVYMRPLLNGNIRLYVRCLKDTLSTLKYQPSNRFNTNRKHHIVDEDGYSNLRESPWGGIIRKVYSQERFIVLDTTDKFNYVEFADGEKGYIHQSRVSK